ncbi:DUF2218 domain-containing protein [Paracoccus spongiarum]|uniref:DUF2218 domain-containing protein n=1 Tax=Paracoccus spongiarum TaxID=3064387 RepID=A0ABT9JA31_9RHOB|nr:DUF2218 domain-containing protein [Paracoccus sp. 2205BS29-5]MDP5306670.1 DUF2218 domain-containing protein [Paracoccus sp. 2205BS29-5]
MEDQITATGRHATPHARKYMTQLCKHFAHKIPASTEGETGEICFDIGTARLQAGDDLLSVRLTGTSPEALTRMQGILDSHLQRFAFREAFAGIDWQTGAA